MKTTTVYHNNGMRETWQGNHRPCIHIVDESLTSEGVAIQFDDNGFMARQLYAMQAQMGYIGTNERGEHMYDTSLHGKEFDPNFKPPANPRAMSSDRINLMLDRATPQDQLNDILAKGRRHLEKARGKRTSSIFYGPAMICIREHDRGLTIANQ